MNIFLDLHAFWREVARFFRLVHEFLRWTVAIALAWLGPMRRRA